MRYPRQQRQQRTLMFEPQPRVSLPEAARQEAVAVLAALIAAVTRRYDVKDDSTQPFRVFWAN